jgi:hypothetical protein
MMQGLSYKQMMERLNIDRCVLNKDVCAIYQIHGVSKLGLKGRRALAEKLGVTYVTKGNEIRARVAELRERGLTLKDQEEK